MTFRQATEYYIVMNVIVTVIWTVVARLVSGPEATVSTVTQDACYRYPLLACLFGLVVGHIMWPVR